MLVRLHKDAGVALRGDSRGSLIRCEEGIIWLTQTGDPADHFLCASETFLVRRKGTIIVEARRDASVSLPDDFHLCPLPLPSGNHRSGRMEEATGP